MPSRLRSFPGSVAVWCRMLCAAAVLAWPAVAAAQNGTVSGIVTEAGTGAPIAGASVTVVTVRGSAVAGALTDATGAYSISVPPGALYYLSAFEPSHVTKIHPDTVCLSSPVSCSSDEFLVSTPFSMSAGGAVSGKYFALQRTGRITGRVTNAANGTPISNALVGVFKRLGTSSLGIGYSTNTSGDFAATGLPPGTYYLATFLSPGQGFQNEIYPDVPCNINCQTPAILASTPITVTEGGTDSGRDFALDPAGRLNGRVTNTLTGDPIQGVQVTAAARIGTSNVTSSAITNAAGDYTILGLSTSSYRVFTSSSTTTNEIHPDILCPISCSTATAIDSGTGVPVTLGGTSTVNFGLDPGGNISGTVTNSAGTALPNAGVLAVVRLGVNIAFRNASTDTTGAYTVRGLPTGSYVLFTSASGHLNKIFDNQPCPGGTCTTTSALATGTPVTVSSGATTSGRDFSLEPAPGTTGALSGTVTDASSGLPIAGISVDVFIASGTALVRQATLTSNVQGQYAVSNLLAGSYRVATTGAHPYRNEAFDSFPCLGSVCSTATVAGATPVTITVGGTATANFGLSAGDGIDGTVTDAATGAPVAGVQVNFVQVPSGANAGSSTTNAAGRFVIRGLPNGEYVAYTSNSLGYFDEIYNNIRCTPVCGTAAAIASGTRITLTGASAMVGADLAELVSGLNIALDVRNDAPNAPSGLRIVTSGGTAQFVWNAPSLFDGGAPTSYLLEAGGAPGATFITLPIPGTGTTFSVSGVPPGTYFVRVRGVNAGGTGPVSNEIRLVVGAAGTGMPDPPTSVVAFTIGSHLTMTWTAPLGGGPPTGYVVEAGSATGLANIASLNVTTPTFSFDGVPPGFYFLRVRSRNAAGVSLPSAEAMIVVGNVPAPPGAPTFTGASVTAGTVTLGWAAPSIGTATSYIIEAGSATGLSDLATFNTGSTALTRTFTGVPPGRYFLRLRAVNAQGASVASSELTVTVS